MAQMRQRYSATNETDQTMSSPNAPFTKPAQPGDALTASFLLKSNPSHYGQVMKLNIPLLYSLSPTWLQRIFRYCPSPLRPTWKKRYMIQIGKYLYRFKIDGAENGNGPNPEMKIKGTPIPLETILIKPVNKTLFGGLQIDRNEFIALPQDLPSFCDGYFSMTSSGETRYYAVSSKEDANTWTNSIRQGRQANIEKKMNHDRAPYPESWKYIDRMGEERVERNGRIKKSMKVDERREMEMMQFMDGDGGVGRGHYS